MEITFKQRFMSFGMALSLAILPIGANAAISNNDSANSNEPCMEELKEDQEAREYEKKCQIFIDELSRKYGYDRGFNEFLLFMKKFVNRSQLPRKVKESFMSGFTKADITRYLKKCCQRIGMCNNKILISKNSITDASKLFNPDEFFDNDDEKKIVTKLFQDVIDTSQEFRIAMNTYEDYEYELIKGPCFNKLLDDFFDILDDDTISDEFRIAVIEFIGWPFFNYLLEVMDGRWDDYVYSDGNVNLDMVPDFDYPNDTLEELVIWYIIWINHCTAEYETIDRIQMTVNPIPLNTPTGNTSKFTENRAVYSDSLNTIFVVPRNKQYQLIKDRKFKQVKRA